MSQQNRRIGSILLACLIITSAIACLTAAGRFRLHLFDFGLRHGVEDKQSGIIYATDAPGLKIFRNSARWTQGDKLLVYRIMTASPEASKREISIFMAGYNCGYHSVVGGIFLVSAILVLAGFYSLRKRHVRAKQRIGASHDLTL